MRRLLLSIGFSLIELDKYTFVILDKRTQLIYLPNNKIQISTYYTSWLTDMLNYSAFTLKVYCVIKQDTV